MAALRAALPLLLLATAAFAAERAEPQAAVQPATAGEAAIAAATVAVPVRTGRHPGYGRMVFDWPVEVGYAVRRQGDLLTLSFDQPARIDLGRVVAGLRPLVVEARAEREGVVLRLAPGLGLRHFRLEDQRVVVDLLEPSEALPPPEAARRPDGPPSPPHPAPPVPAPAAASPEAAPEPPAAPALDIVVAWPRPEPAAVFVRAGHLFVVVAAPAEAASELTLAPDPASGIGPGERLATAASATALRFPLLRDGEVAVARDGGAWRIRLEPEAVPPRPAPLLRLDGPARLRLPGAAGPVEIVDPDVGDRLAVAPLAAPGHGMPQRRRLVDLELLPSAQGIVWRPRADGLVASADEQGLELGRPGGLRLSPPEPEPDAAAVPVELASVPLPDAAALGLAGPSLDDESLLATRRGLEQAVLAAPAAERGLARLELARFLLGQALAAEALGVLAIVDPDAAPASSRLELARAALGGAAQLLMGRDEAARAGLAMPRLDHDDEAALWRALVAARGGDQAQAEGELLRGLAALAAYPPRLQGRLGPKAARILIDAGRADAAYALLDRLAGYALAPEALARARFERALALARDGAVGEARRIWAELARGPHEETAVRAQFAEVTLALERRETTPEAAARAMAAELPFWRDHPDEPAMLDRLARLQAELGESPSALANWKRAMTLRPEPPEAEAVGGRMRAHLVAVLGGDGAAAPGPVAAMALYEAYPELVPPGEEGDRLLRGLAARLAALDLTQPAADLLERLVRLRLSGPARAEAGAELALLLLRAGAHRGALEALEASATGAELAPTLERRRARLAALALLEGGRPAAALARLEGDDGREARALRLEIHWQSRDWPAVAGLAIGLLPQRERPPAGTLLEDEERAALRLALALAAQGDEAGLARLRARIDPEALSPPHRAAYAMATAPAAAAGPTSARLAAAEDAARAARALIGDPRP